MPYNFPVCFTFPFNVVLAIGFCLLNNAIIRQAKINTVFVSIFCRFGHHKSVFFFQINGFNKVIVVNNKQIHIVQIFC